MLYLHCLYHWTKTNESVVSIWTHCKSMMSVQCHMGIQEALLSESNHRWTWLRKYKIELGKHSTLNLYLAWQSVFNWEEIIYSSWDLWGWCHWVFSLPASPMLYAYKSSHCTGGVKKKVHCVSQTKWSIGLDCLNHELKCFSRK